MSNRKTQAHVWEGLRISHPNAAGLDIGSEEIWVPLRRAAQMKPYASSGPIRQT